MYLAGADAATFFDRDGRVRLFGVGIAVVFGVGLVVLSRLGLNGAFKLEGGLMGQMLLGSALVIAVGSAAAAAIGRSFRAGLQASLWATILGGVLAVAAWLEEAPHWDRARGGSLLDAATVSIGSNLGDALWWVLITLVLFALPFGVIGAARECNESVAGARAPR